MEISWKILHILADGGFHSGADLGRALGISRTAVWKHLQKLEPYGLHLQAVRGRGYRLPEPLELLDADRIRAGVARPSPRLPAPGIEVQPVLDSTNQHLMRQLRQGGLRGGEVCLAEYQSAGRGRRGRQWVSPFGQNLYLSLGWRFTSAATALAGLSLAVAVAVARALEGFGLQGIQLKWPNDLLWDGRKLGGILLEMAGEALGPCSVVIGIGINVNMQTQPGQEIEQPWTDLQHILGRPVSRNDLAVAVIQRLWEALEQYEAQGFGGFRAEWQARDCMQDQAVRVLQPGQVTEGIARGVDEQGALLLESQGATRHLLSGEVSVRMCP